MDHDVLPAKSMYCTLVNKSNNVKYVCYSHRKAGVFNIGLTNASEVWSTDFTEETFAEHRKKFALTSAEDYISKIRSACRSGSASVSTLEEGVSLQLGGTTGAVTVTLSRLSDPEASEALRDLLFGMADTLTNLNAAGGSPSSSFMKGQFRRNPDFEPRRQQNGPTVAVRKRLPGDSLINPGSRRKRPATGVAFDDSEDL
ncbi:protein PAXX [Megalops cyprinoides]|uniref:protein PAXX n=1 Tax=Megalops cyprinoides TaxID=118141 RepID=UPI00186554F5|nr:protein PAXX [Megalops cyprinoides]